MNILSAGGDRLGMLKFFIILLFLCVFSGSVKAAKSLEVLELEAKKFEEYILAFNEEVSADTAILFAGDNDVKCMILAKWEKSFPRSFVKAIEMANDLDMDPSEMAKLENSFKSAILSQKKIRDELNCEK